ncbi:MAG: ribosomal protein S18-alanine N-acetyltransferase [Christensenellales bacterium]|jgi:ribosomal-protein-alanine N-acetyltransferase
MSELVIRNMKRGDIGRIMALENLCFSMPWSKMAFISELENDMALYLVAESAGRIIGYAGLWTVLDEGHITNVAVHPLCRRQGVATELLKALKARAAPLGIRSLTLEVRVSNVAARKLYETFGFKPAGVRKRYYENNNEDALIMWWCDE